MSFTIGEEIRKKIEQKGIKNVTFAEQMGIGERNLYHFFKKTEIPLDQLIAASNILDYDFIELYLRNSPKKLKTLSGSFGEAVSEYRTRPIKKHEISLTVNICGEIETIKNEFTNFLEIMKKEAETRGLHLG